MMSPWGRGVGGHQKIILGYTGRRGWVYENPSNWVTSFLNGPLLFWSYTMITLRLERRRPKLDSHIQLESFWLQLRCYQKVFQL